MAVADKIEGIFAEEKRDNLFFLMLNNLVWPLLVVVFLGFSLLLPESFLTRRNIEFLLYSSAALSAITLAESICLLSGHFDLSVGAIAGFSAMLTAKILVNWFPAAPGVAGIAIILLIGGIIGAMNGFSVAYLDVNPFLQTLAFLIIFQGGILIISSYPVANLPKTYTYIGGGAISGIPIAVFLTLAIYALFGFIMKYTRFGLKVYSVGGNKEAAEEAGIDTKRIVLSVYIISGVLAALGGLIYSGFLQAATPSLAQNDLFPAFAAAVIGGISLFGGRGNLAGALAGVLLLGSIEAGLVMLRVGPTIIQTVDGIVLLVAILLYTYVEKYRERNLTA